MGAAAGVSALMTAVGSTGSAVATTGSIACAAVALTVAVLVGRLTPVPSPGAIGAAIAVVGASTVVTVPVSWREVLPDGGFAVAAVVACVAAVIWLGTREPTP